MARRAALTLDDLATTRSAPATAGSKETSRTRRGQTLRLEPEAWKQLKMLAIAEGKTSHDLLIEAVNLLFHHYNRPTIAG
jgi:hypothetical protein